MTTREWAVPVALGLLVAAALTQVPHGPPAPQPISSATSATPGVRAAPRPDAIEPFATAKAIPGTNVTFVVLAPNGKAALLANLTHRDPAGVPALVWRSDHLAMLDSAAGPPCGSGDSTSGPCGGASHGRGWPLPVLQGIEPQDAGPRLGLDGYNATAVTVYVFDTAGNLFASNANDNGRFPGGGQARALPGGLWYLGDADTPPAGTQEVPALAGALMTHLLPLMHGLPVGGVASLQTNAAVAIYGTLFVTLRIDALQHAA